MGLSRELRTVQRAATRRRDSDRAYVTAIQAARASGHTLAAIGQAAGVGKAAVRQLLLRNPTPEGGTE